MVEQVHECDERCVCPEHGTALIYSPRLDVHACRDSECVHAHGLRSERPPMTYADYLAGLKISHGDVVEVQYDGKYLPVIFDPDLKPKPGTYLCLNCGHDPYSPQCADCRCYNHWPRSAPRSGIGR